MSYLADKIFQEHGLESANHLIRTFRSLALPVPETCRDYRSTADDGALVFLNEAACVLRVTGQRHPRYDHPHILHPIATFPDEKIRIELYPGITCPGKEEDMDFLSSVLARNNLQINNSDRHKFNVGYLPLKTNLFPHGVPVIIEMTAIAALTEKVRQTAQKLKQHQQNQQRNFYAPLREAFEQAFSKSEMDSFWSKCRELRKQGTLIAGWQSPTDHLETKLDATYLTSCKEAADNYQALQERKMNRP